MTHGAAGGILGGLWTSRLQSSFCSFCTTLLHMRHLHTTIRPCNKLSRWSVLLYLRFRFSTALLVPSGS